MVVIFFKLWGTLLNQGITLNGVTAAIALPFAVLALGNAVLTIGNQASQMLCLACGVSSLLYKT
ncbi:hypothetical protein [Anabaena sp. CS-542/02]|uniref:hypothetical protein n=1 Tax=Anabaena sp. CS-542/02 TaxID=3021719 RepID=UPI00232D56A7|nr:hypothetical protein [Anabaena sp. CS-542/02]MDB9447683.1 hypothetical protein [Anabaena sp. CS-542/02]